MLTALPIVLACYGVQPCQPAAAVREPLVRSLSPAAVVSHAMPREALTTDGTRPFELGLQHIAIPSPFKLPQKGAQVALPRGARTGATKAMLVFAGVIAGCYVGAHLGEAMEENGGFPGMTIGAGLGGLIAWTLVK